MANATIYDVSRLSGVSTATVSRAFSDPDSVREATRRKVYEAAGVLKYQPNAIARAMARQRTDKIAFLICKKGATILDEFYASVCEGIMSKTSGSEYQLLISTAEEWRKNFGNAQSKHIEGVILGGDVEPELVSALQRQDVKVVVVNNHLTGFDVPCVLADERSGVNQAIDHMVKRGHRHIGMITGRFSPYIIRERYTAFVACMKGHGLPLESTSIKMCEPTIGASTQAALELLDRPDRPTAVFASNDVIAAGIMKAARRLGLRIPEELALVGVDDSRICNMLEPELSSVHISCHQMGAASADLLYAMLDGETDLPRTTVIPTELIVRRSC